MQGTRIQSLVWEESTGLAAIKPVCHSYWGSALEPMSSSHWAQELRARALQQEKPLQQEAQSPQLKSSPTHHN